MTTKDTVKSVKSELDQFKEEITQKLSEHDGTLAEHTSNNADVKTANAEISKEILALADKARNHVVKPVIPNTPSLVPELSLKSAQRDDHRLAGTLVRQLPNAQYGDVECPHCESPYPLCRAWTNIPQFLFQFHQGDGTSVVGFLCLDCMKVYGYIWDAQKPRVEVPPEHNNILSLDNQPLNEESV